MYGERFRLYRKKASSPDRKWTKDLSRHFSKQGEWMGNEHVNRGSTSIAVRESRLNLKAVSRPPVKLAKVKTPTAPSSGEDAEQLGCPTAGTGNGAATLAHSMAVSYRAKHTLDV